MDATQQIEESFFGEKDDSDEDHDLGEGKRPREPLAVLKVLKNIHIQETEIPLYLGENVLGRDPSSCSVPLQARSVSAQHAIVSISMFGPNDRHAHSEATEALLWDLGSLNGTRKGRLKLTPHVRYALTEGESVVLADLPCQYVRLKNTEWNLYTSDGRGEKAQGPTSNNPELRTEKVAENCGKKSELPPVPVWSDDRKNPRSVQMTPKQPEMTLVPESDSDSDEEKRGRRERRKIVAADLVSSDLSSPTCSTFLTPANKVIPESEDESSITPSPALICRFLKTGNDTEVSSDSSKPDPLHFNMDSDTDVEDEEVERMKAIPAAIVAKVDAVSSEALHMDSDTDVEEEEMEMTKNDPEMSGASAEQILVNPAALSMDSDTDVEEYESVETDTAPISGPEAALVNKKEPATSHFHLDSDSNVKDEDGVHILDSRPPSSNVVEFNMSSDADVEVNKETAKATETPSSSEVNSDLVKQATSVGSAKVPDAKMLYHQSESDTDVEDDVTGIRTPMVTKVTGSSPTLKNLTVDVQHDSPVPVQPIQDEFRLDSDTDVEEDEQKMEERERKPPAAIIKSSTPKGAGLSEEDLETQAFLSPSQLFKRPALPSVLQTCASPGGIGHTDDDFVVAETQSFVCGDAQDAATLDETPQSLDVPDSRCSDGHSFFQLKGSVQVQEAESTEDWQLQATQLYAVKNSECSTTTGRTQQDLDATQAYTEVIGQKEDEGEETQPLAALGHSSIQTAKTQLIKHRTQNEDTSDHDSNEEVVGSEPKRKAEEDVNDEMHVDSHLSTADTLLLIRSPRQEEKTQPYTFLPLQIQKVQEDTEKDEHESRDQRVQEIDEGERVQNEMVESVGQENDKEAEREVKESERMVTEKKIEVTTEEERHERDDNQRVENDTEVEAAQTQPAEIVETLPMCEEEGGQDKEQLNEPSFSRGRQLANVESAQPLEPDVYTHVSVAETLPMCEEEEGLEEELNKPRTSSGPGRKRRTSKAETKLHVESDRGQHVTIAETKPMCDEIGEGQEEEQQSEAISSRRSSMRGHNAKAKPAKPVTIPETLPKCDAKEEQKEKLQRETKFGRKSFRGRQTPTTEATQPLEGDSIAEPLKMEEEEEEQRSRRSLRVKEKDRAASCKGQGKGRAAAEKGKRSKNGKVEKEEDGEEEVDRGNKGKGRKDLRKKSKDDDKTRLLETENEEQHLKEEEEESNRLCMEKMEEARLETEEKEREESTRLKKEREEREQHEKREQEEKDRLERERLEKERHKKEQLEREKQLEKEMREQEEKDRLEQERVERENKDKEEQEIKEIRDETDRSEREKRERDEKEMREEEKKEKETGPKKKENESKDNKEGVEKEKRQGPGKRKAVLERKGRKSKKDDQELEGGNKPVVETEQELSELQKCEEGSNKKQEDEETQSEEKPKRGRRTTRITIPPPPGLEDGGGPASRTRSRSNSSNSVCSEKSNQDCLSEGRSRGGRKKTAEVNERGRTSSRRKTTTPSSEKEDIKQPAHSRSTSRSSDRSSSNVATRSQGRGGKSRKSGKPEEEGGKSAAMGRGRGRGRGGKHLGTNDLKAEATSEPEQEKSEVMDVSEDSVTSQSSSRGRKRGADVSRMTAESPQPSPKTPRRCLTGQTHKILFTGVVDEDGEKVVVRLGGGLAKGVGDMTHLVTDKVRRTVKFLCAVARGVPIITPDWLSKCGKAGSFVSPNGFLVKDVEQEKRFNFSLQEALRVASSQPLLQGYEIHVTPSVKPEPAQMKEIITCCGARFLPKMPSVHKAKTVVVSCEEDKALCERARTLSLPVVSAEFLLTGILQQKVDTQTHALSLVPAAALPKPAARSRGK